MPTLTIDGQTITVPAGTSVLQACQRLGIEIPHFRRHPLNWAWDYFFYERAVRLILVSGSVSAPRPAG